MQKSINAKDFSNELNLSYQSSQNANQPSKLNLKNKITQRELSQNNNDLLKLPQIKIVTKRSNEQQKKIQLDYQFPMLQKQKKQHEVQFTKNKFKIFTEDDIERKAQKDNTCD